MDVCHCLDAADKTAKTSNAVIDRSPMAYGTMTGMHIHVQLDADQLDIGSAFGWNALTATIEAVSIAPGHGMHPIL